MASAAITRKDGTTEVIEDIEDLSMQPPYWMVKFKKDGDIFRTFISFESVYAVVIHGEDELIAAAKARVGNPEKLAQDLGLE